MQESLVAYSFVNVLDVYAVDQSSSVSFTARTSKSIRTARLMFDFRRLLNLLVMAIALASFQSVRSQDTVTLLSTNPSINYVTVNAVDANPTWTEDPSTNSTCSTQMITSRLKDYMSYTFNGTAVSVYGTIGTKRGVVLFSIDGSMNTTFDRTDSALVCNATLYSMSGLSPGVQHTLLATLVDLEPAPTTGALEGVFSVQSIQVVAPDDQLPTSTTSTSVPSRTNSSASPKKSSAKAGVVAGAIIGILALLALITVAAYFLRRRLSRRTSLSGVSTGDRERDGLTGPEFATPAPSPTLGQVMSGPAPIVWTVYSNEQPYPHTGAPDLSPDMNASGAASPVSLGSDLIAEHAAPYRNNKLYPHPEIPYPIITPQSNVNNARPQNTQAAGKPERFSDRVYQQALGRILNSPGATSAFGHSDNLAVPAEEDEEGHNAGGTGSDRFVTSEEAVGDDAKVETVDDITKRVESMMIMAENMKRKIASPSPISPPASYTTPKLSPQPKRPIITDTAATRGSPSNYRSTKPLGFANLDSIVDATSTPNNSGGRTSRSLTSTPELSISSARSRLHFSPPPPVAPSARWREPSPMHNRSPSAASTAESTQSHSSYFGSNVV